MDIFCASHIHISRGCRSSMDNDEIRIVERFSETLLHEEVNLPSAATYLWEQELIHRDQLHELMGCFDRRPYLKFVELFIKLVTENIRLEEFIQALYFSRNESAAQKLFRMSLSMQSESGNQVLAMHRLDTRNKRSIESYFRYLKRVVHNGKLEEPFKWLRKLAREIKVRMDKEQNLMKKQFYADKYVAHLGAEIDAMAITFDKELPDSEIFDDLKSLSETSSQPLISDIVYFGRRANALAIAGRFEEGENMVVGAHCCATFAGPCLEIANMIYIDVYFKLWQFEQTPSLQLQRELIFAGNKGLWALSEEDEDTRNLWTRMFLLRMIFCLLGIGNKANMISNYEVPQQNLPEAEKLINAIKLEGIETRRAMFYWVAKARQFELLNLGTLSVQSIENADELAKKGHFKEIVNIETYAAFLKERFPDLNTSPEETALTLPSADQLSGTNATSQQPSSGETYRKEMVSITLDDNMQQTRTDFENVFANRDKNGILAQILENIQPDQNEYACDQTDNHDETKLKDLDITEDEETTVKEISSDLDENSDSATELAQSLTYSVVVEDFESKGSFSESKLHNVKVDFESSSKDEKDDSEAILDNYETLNINSLLDNDK